MARCFVGYLLPEKVKEELVDVQKLIEKWPLTCKMVERENIHLNFSFLGEIDEKQVENISEKIDAIGKMFENFEVEVGGLCGIPSESYIRVLSLDIIDENRLLKTVIEEVNRQIGGDTKPAHVTLCRVREIRDKNYVREKIDEERSKRHGKFAIDSIQLIKSELSRSGPVYSVVHEAKLLS